MTNGKDGLRADARAYAKQAFDTDFDEGTAEHILLEGDGRLDAPEEPSRPARLTETRRFELHDRLRGRSMRLVLYGEGMLRVESWRRGKAAEAHRLDLRYLDAAPLVESYRPRRALDVALVLVVLAGLAAVLGAIGVPAAYAASVGGASAAGALVALGTYWYRSRETATFLTLHGRAPALRLRAGLGSIHRCRAILPELAVAIEDAAEEIGGDTRSYLRGEMREHYRLRSDGVLTSEVCSDSTGRILAQFDVDL